MEAHTWKPTPGQPSGSGHGPAGLQKVMKTLVAHALSVPRSHSPESSRRHGCTANANRNKRLRGNTLRQGGGKASFLPPKTFPAGIARRSCERLGSVATGVRRSANTARISACATSGLCRIDYWGPSSTELMCFVKSLLVPVRRIRECFLPHINSVEEG